MNRTTGKGRRRAGRGATDDRRALGQRGEEHAAIWLERRGYAVLRRNVRIGRCEADIVALAPDEKTIVVVEVKTRTRDLTPPELAVNARKREHIVGVAAALARVQPYAAHPFRFDVVAVVWPRGGEPHVRHIESAFEAGF
jgi:putative endonuclease